MAKPTLLAMYGLPRSGKSTITATLRHRFGCPVVNQDAIRLALHGHAYLAKAEPMVRAIMHVMVESLFLAGHKIVILDETCYSRAKRDSLKSSLWNVKFYEVPTDPDTCKQRAIATQQEYLLPVIDEMWARREPLGEDEYRYDPSTDLVC